MVCCCCSVLHLTVLLLHKGLWGLLSRSCFRLIGQIVEEGSFILPQLFRDSFCYFTVLAGRNLLMLAGSGLARLLLQVFLFLHLLPGLVTDPRLAVHWWSSTESTSSHAPTVTSFLFVQHCSTVLSPLSLWSASKCLWRAIWKACFVSGVFSFTTSKFIHQIFSALSLQLFSSWVLLAPSDDPIRYLLLAWLSHLLGNSFSVGGLHCGQFGFLSDGLAIPIL